MEPIQTPDMLIATLKQELDAAEQADDRKRQLPILQQLGALYEQQACFVEATDMLEKACSLADLLSDQARLSRLLNRLGCVLQRQNRFDEAITVLQESRNLAEMLDDQHRLGKVFYSLGSVLRRQGWVEEAIELFEQSHTLLQELHVPGDHIVVLNNLADMYYKQNLQQKSQDTYHRCLALSERLEDKRYLAFTYTSMGKTFLRHGDAEQALYAFDEAFAVNEAIPHLKGLALVLPNLLDTLGELDRAHEADDYCQRALRLDPENRHFNICLRRLDAL